MAKVSNPNFDGGGTKPKSSVQLSKQSHKPKKKVKFKDSSSADKNDGHRAANDLETEPECNRFTGNIYSKPEFHSTLFLAEKLQSIRLDTFNEDEAIRKKLEQCDKVRKRIISKSVKHVNVPASVSIFKDMIPLEFDENALVRAAAEEKAARWRNVMPKSVPKDPEPRLEEFLTPENQPEFFTMPAPQFHFPQLQTLVTPATTNQLYLHRRRWENLP